MNAQSKRILGTAGLVGLALAGFGCQATTKALATSSNAAARGALVASGTIKTTEIHVGSELGGRILEIRAQEGEQVKAGETLVVLDSTPWSIQLTPAEAAVKTSQADLNMTKAPPRVEAIAAARAAVSLAQAQRDGALRAWQDAQAEVNNPQDLDSKIIDARTQVNQAAQGVELAKAKLAAAETVRDRGTLKREAADWQVQAAQAGLTAAQADQKTAQTLLDQLVAIRNHPLGLMAAADVAQGQYEVAQAGVAVAQARLDDLLAGSTPEEIAISEATVHQAEAAANVLRIQVDKCTVTSPGDGIVLSRALKPGEIAAPSASILTLADLSTVNLDVYVPENRIGEVKLGQTAKITVDSFPGKTFTGQVSHIKDEPEFTPRNVATAEERLNTFYVVELKLPNSDGLLKPGMPADATFN